MLSIRTQDEMSLIRYDKITLLNVEKISEETYIDYTNEPKIEWWVVVMFDTKSWGIARYATKERALEILDEIDYRIRTENKKVYRMPKE